MADQTKPDISLNSCSERSYLRYMADYLDRLMRLEDPKGKFVEMPDEIAELYARALRSIAERF
jgi:hypothetical protein